MKKLVLPALLLAILSGCSSSPASNDNKLTTIAGGQSVGDVVSFYWYTEQLSFPYSAADHVNSGVHGWYQSDYRWRDNVLREVIRQGEQGVKDQGLLPYKVHLRFNKKGEAVYQQYRLDGKVLPMQAEQISLIQQGALSIKETVKAQDEKGHRLIQGYWDGKKFKTCSGDTYKNIEFNQILPTFVLNRLANLDSYAAFLGSQTPTKLTVLDLYTLDDESVDCVTRPVIIEE